METPMQTWAIVIFPEFQPEQRTLIDRLRASYDPLASAIAPHVTLVFPFEALLSAGDLLAHMRASVATIAPFAVELRGVTGQEDEYLFLNVKRGNDEIIALHDQLYTGPLAPYRSPRYTYTPHLTVGRLTPGEGFDTALAEASTLTETFQTTIREITGYRISAAGGRGEKYSVQLWSPNTVPMDG